MGDSGLQPVVVVGGGGEDEITTDKGVYGQSGIGNATAMQELISNMEDAYSQAPSPSLSTNLTQSPLKDSPQFCSLVRSLM